MHRYVDKCFNILLTGRTKLGMVVVENILSVAVVWPYKIVLLVGVEQ